VVLADRSIPGGYALVCLLTEIEQGEKRETFTIPRQKNIAVRFHGWKGGAREGTLNRPWKSSGYNLGVGIEIPVLPRRQSLIIVWTVLRSKDEQCCIGLALVPEQKD
jgi:hypothetical protein